MKISSLILSVTLSTILLVSGAAMAASSSDKNNQDEARISTEQKNADAANKKKNDQYDSTPAKKSAEAKSSAGTANDNPENIEPAAGQGDTKTPTTLDEMRGIY